jgi:cytochrome c peroxidase
MHDGSEATLRDVIELYDRGGNTNPHLAKEIRPLALTATEKSDLLAFLEALTGPGPKIVAPKTFPK